MRPEEFTEDHYNDLVQFMQKEVGGLHVVYKRDAAEMVLIEKGLEKVSSLIGDEWISPQAWMERYATTLATKVYIPEPWSPYQKCAGLVHEVEHVLQWKERQPQSDLPPNVQFAWLYLTWGMGRVRSEVEAYRAGQLEFAYEMTGVLTPLSEMKKPLEGTAYLLSEKDQENSRILLAAAGTTVSQGVAPSTNAARLGVRWARERGLI